MNLQDLEKIIADHESYKAQGFRDGDNHISALVVTRKRPPAGIKISTPFGLCEIANCQQTKSGDIQIVFWVTKKQVERMIERIKNDKAN